MDMEKMTSSCGVGVGPKEEKRMAHLLGVINNTISRYQEAINRYGIMNDGLVGCEPEAAGNDSLVSSNGIVSELIQRAEHLHDLCADFDRQNNRLNNIIIDG